LRIVLMNGEIGSNLSKYPETHSATPELLQLLS
jgi:hypothetical protein